MRRNFVAGGNLKFPLKFKKRIFKRQITKSIAIDSPVYRSIKNFFVCLEIALFPLPVRFFFLMFVETKMSES